MAETFALLHRRRQRIAKGLYQFAEQFGRGRYRDLLAEDRAHRELKAVPRAGHAQARPRRDQRRQYGIEREMRADRIGIGGEIEHPAHPRDDLRQGRHIGKANRTSIAVLRRRRNADHAAHARRSRWCGDRYRRQRSRRREWRGRRGTTASHPNRRAADRADAPTARRLRAGSCRGNAAARPAGVRTARRKVSLKRRTLLKPEASATCAIGSDVSWISCLASSTRRVCATAIGEAPTC